MNDLQQLVGTVAFIAATVAANAFIILYSLLARWWRNALGWNIFSFMLAVALILDHSVITLLWRDYPGRIIVRAFLFTALAVVMWWRVIILIFVQVLMAKKKDDSPEPPSIF